MSEFVERAKALADARKSTAVFFESDLRDIAESSATAQEGYDSIVYLQQVMSLVPLDDWRRALDSVHRLMKPNGRFLVSFCQHEGRAINQPLRLLLLALRFVRGQQISGYSQPLLKLGGKLNRNFFHREQFVIHWLPRDMIEQRLRTSGFRIVESTTSAEVRGKANPNRGMLYLLCEKS